MIVPVEGKTPGRRYGHSLVFLKPYLVTFGGSNVIKVLGDVCCLSVKKAPYFLEAAMIASLQ